MLGVLDYVVCFGGPKQNKSMIQKHKAQSRNRTRLSELRRWHRMHVGLSSPLSCAFSYTTILQSLKSILNDKLFILRTNENSFQFNARLIEELTKISYSSFLAKKKRHVSPYVSVYF